MPVDLERDLGLYATITISIGAMVGSGIFVLPGKAADITGPSVILAYLLAGLFVVPAALSKAEMATAMPESGGTYLYIDRALGPRLGSVAIGGALGIVAIGPLWYRIYGRARTEREGVALDVLRQRF